MKQTLSSDDNLDAILDLLGCDIIGGAFTHLNRLGAGGTATVFAHPTRMDLVVRVSDYPDGWFQYAHDLASDDGGPHYGPQVHEMTCVNDVWVALATRLQELPFDIETYARLGAARRIICPDHYGEATPGDIEMIEGDQPGFCDFADRHLAGARDLTDENFMTDGVRLIVNDPFRGMSLFDAERLAQIHSSPLKSAA